jgi:hypothetical protein
VTLQQSAIDSPTDCAAAAVRFDGAVDRLNGLGRAWDLAGIIGICRRSQLGHHFDLQIAVLQRNRPPRTVLRSLS